MGAGEFCVRKPGPDGFEQANVRNGNWNRLLLPGFVPDSEKTAAGFVRGKRGVTFEQEFTERAGGAGGEMRFGQMRLVIQRRTVFCFANGAAESSLFVMVLVIHFAEAIGQSKCDWAKMNADGIVHPFGHKIDS